MNPFVAATEYPRLRRAYYFTRMRRGIRRAFDRTPLGSPATRRLLCTLLFGSAAAGTVLVLAAVVGVSGGLAAGVTAGTFVLALLTAAALVLIGSDDALAARKVALDRDLPEARAAWLLYRKQLQVEREARRAKSAVRMEKERAENRRSHARAERGTRPRARSAGHWLDGNGSFSLEVIGESHYQRALERVCGGRTAASQDRVVTAVLVLEDDNPYDRQAVCVTVNGYTVGYLPRDKARAFRARVRREGLHGDEFECQANIRGGWDRGDGDRGYFGVWLDVVIYRR